MASVLLNQDQPNVVHIQPNVVYVSPVPFGPRPVVTTCPNCRQQILTVTQPVSGSLTWILCIFVCGLFAFCFDSFKDVEHSCPQCNAFIHRYKRM